MIDDDGSTFHSDEGMQRQNTYRLLVKLSENCGILRKPLSISGITGCGREPVHESGSADIFRASFNGGEVALKCLRDFQIHKNRELTHRVSVS